METAALKKPSNRAEYLKKWQETHKDYIREKSRKWYIANKEHVAELRKIRYQANKEKHNAQSKQWAKNNPERSKFLRKRKMLLRNYNMTIEQFNKMVEIQESKCAICKKPASLHVDHCHATNKIRALLCGPCNRGIGMFKENIDVLLEAINYINRHKT